MQKSGVNGSTGIRVRSVGVCKYARIFATTCSEPKSMENHMLLVLRFVQPAQPVEHRETESNVGMATSTVYTVHDYGSLFLRRESFRHGM